MPTKCRPIPVILLQYGRFELAEACIRSLREQTVPVEVWLVDGNSPGKTEEILSAQAKLADRTIFLEENLGYAAANNVAIRQVIEEGYEFFLILNSDTVVAPEAVENLVRAMAEHSQAAQVCPKVVYPEGQLQAAGGGLSKPLYEPYPIGHLGKQEEYSDPAQVIYAPGMAVLVRSGAAKEVGLIPEDYFMYAEDVDWSLEFTQAGWEIWYCPEARVQHFDSASMGSYSRNKGRYMTRANVLLAHKWTGPREWSSFRHNFLWKLIKQSLKQARHRAFVQGMWEGYREGMRQVKEQR